MSGLPKPLGISYSDEIDRRWRSMLMAFFFRRTHDRFEAEDLTQEALTRGLGNCQVADSRTKYYLFAIAVNLLRDRARRANSHRLNAHASFSDPALRAEDIPAEDFEPERVLIGKESLQAVLTALSELDERTRDIFVLFRLEKMRQKEIAALFGISASAVEKHVVKAAVYLAARSEKHV